MTYIHVSTQLVPHTQTQSSHTHTHTAHTHTQLTQLTQRRLLLSHIAAVQRPQAATYMIHTQYMCKLLFKANYLKATERSKNGIRKYIVLGTML